MSKVNYRFLDRPGSYLSEQEIRELTHDLRSVASLCFDKVPDYQCLTGKKEELSECVIIIAYINEKPVGFSSSLFIEKDILHLGLTCVIPEARGLSLTHKLMSKLLKKYLIKNKIIGRLYVTNCACVISSLGNIALNFEGVYPSPFNEAGPTHKQKEIARKISSKYRKQIAIDKNAEFDEELFIFKRSVKGTVFQKSAEDKQYYHRNSELTDFYMRLMNFEEGDEVLQVASLSLLNFPLYIYKQMKKKSKIKKSQDQRRAA